MLAAGTQGVGGMVGGQTGNTIMNTGNQLVNASNAIQTGQGVDALNAIG